jgi:hypothetical protein
MYYLQLITESVCIKAVKCFISKKRPENFVFHIAG